ncbi:uncharacterized protein LOC104584030 [Brachypodium distachyon]|uniref:uncharacterized protein LOC104584030 n=1 Tax=Brachypodium distachyon TaxID=15368 RepID=UPI00052FF4F0|nr:uncharacterized protein LOC104584030 [Brachypodium distachyon]|eukprot:XP_010236428.1 uncharacterized protein LOC104584030 [Brachypodium distachyon]
MRAFREVLSICDLHNIGFEGLPYTYNNNNNSGRKNVRVRLDRLVVDSNWRDLFNQARVTHLVSPCSDHSPLLVDLLPTVQQVTRKGNRQYELLWERSSEHTKIIANAWDGQSGDDMDIMAQLNKVMEALYGWGKEKFGNVIRELEKARGKLKELLGNGADAREIRKINDSINELLYQEELLWMQRSRINWLKAGDRNTCFFHSKAVWRAKKNKITKLKDSNGNWKMEPPELEKLATDYFKDIFTHDPGLNHRLVSDLFSPKITEHMNTELCKDFSVQEISNALFQIGPIKAPGPDGFPARFYQRNWDTLKDDIVAEVQRFFATGRMLAGMNDTSIVLIPKSAQKLGFATQWISWIMACVTSVRYSIKLNGNLLESFSPTRGLRQGDPLSPLLFLFVADGLSALLQKEAQLNRISPIHICRRSPGVSHLLFADDTLLFFKADSNEASKNEIKIILQVQADGFEAKYLGLPTLEGRMRKDLTVLIRNFWWGAENGRRKTHWVAWDSMLRPKTRGGLGFRDMQINKVSDFIGPDENWNVQLLDTYFLPIDIEEIRKIKLYPDEVEDFVAWAPDKKGVFNVRSAYFLGLFEKEQELGLGESSARPDGSSPKWALLWKDIVPKKVNVFAWKLSRNALATKGSGRRCELTGTFPGKMKL